MPPATSPARLIGAMCVAETLGMVGVFAFPALLPQFFAAWGLSNTQAGWLNGIYFAGYVVAVPVLGSLTDRMDARQVYLVSALVGAAAALGFALFAEGFWTALLFRALGGCGLAGTFIPGLKALVDRLEGHAQARAVSFYTAAFSLGTACSFFVSGEVGAYAGWSRAYAAAAVGALLAGLLAAAVLRPLPASRGDNGGAHLLDFRPVLCHREAMAYVLAYAAHMWELFGMRSWLVAFLAFSLTLQPDGGAYWSPSTVAGITGIIAMWASVAGAELALRFGRLRVLSLIMWGSAIFGCLIGFSAGLPYPVVAALCIAYAMFVQGDSATLHTGTVQTADPARRGATMSVQSVLGFGCAFLGPIVVGMVLDATGGGQSAGSWGAAFIAMGVVVAAGPVILRILGAGALARPVS